MNWVVVAVPPSIVCEKAVVKASPPSSMYLSVIGGGGGGVDPPADITLATPADISAIIIVIPTPIILSYAMNRNKLNHY